MEIIEEKPINAVGLKEEIEKIRKRDKELGIRAMKTEEYLKALIQMSPAKQRELFDKLVALKIPRLKEQHIHKIIDILPTRPEDARLVLQGYTITVSNENLKKIADAINSITEKKK